MRKIRTFVEHNEIYEERKQHSKDEDFARELAMNLSDNEKEYMIVLYAVRKTLEYARDKTNN